MRASWGWVVRCVGTVPAELLRRALVVAAGGSRCYLLPGADPFAVFSDVVGHDCTLHSVFKTSPPPPSHFQAPSPFINWLCFVY